MCMTFSGDDSCKGEAQLCLRSVSHFCWLLDRLPVHTSRDGVSVRFRLCCLLWRTV